MSKAISYARFSKVLKSLGFTERHIAGSHVTFRHVPTKSVILLPPMKATANVPSRYLLAARVTIAGRGICPIQQFDKLIEQGRSNGRRRTADHALALK